MKRRLCLWEVDLWLVCCCNASVCWLDQNPCSYVRLQKEKKNLQFLSQNLSCEILVESMIYLLISFNWHEMFVIQRRSQWNVVAVILSDRHQCKCGKCVIIPIKKFQYSMQIREMSLVAQKQHTLRFSLSLTQQVEYTYKYFFFFWRCLLYCSPVHNDKIFTIPSEQNEIHVILEIDRKITRSTKNVMWMILFIYFRFDFSLFNWAINSCRRTKKGVHENQYIKKFFFFFFWWTIYALSNRRR